MRKIKGWTKLPFRGCTICPRRGRKVKCQATFQEYGVNYCEDCAHHELGKRNPCSGRDEDREWWNSTSARFYV